MKVYLTQDPSRTQKKHRSRSLNLQGGVCNGMMNAPAPARTGINVSSDNIIKKPAEISFSGLSSVEKSARKWMFEFFQAAADKSAASKKVGEVFEEFVTKRGAKIALEDVSIGKSLGKVLDLIKSNKEKPVSEVMTDLTKAISEQAKLKPVGKVLEKFLNLASKNEAVFGAFFAIGLTCLLRPAAIMSLPGKKNKDDKKYASAHSIASGVIGYLISLAVFDPISKGIKKITESSNPAQYFKKGAEYLMKDGKLVTKEWNAASCMVKMLPETIVAAPRAMLTVILIPPILKYVFGLEKKSSPNKELHPVLDNYAAINFRSNKDKTQFQSFMGGAK